MAHKLLFALLHYGALLLFAASCWGYGRALLARALRAGTVDPWLAHGLCITAGLGLWTCALQLLGIAGLLKAPPIYALAAGGWVAAAHPLIAQRRAAGTPVSLPPKMPDLASAIVLLAASATLGSPLRPPHLWDELAYHLPHAREWAEAGSLVINEWLRYPWFPFNFDLLFAAALLLYDDVMPHLIHAMAGWLVALLLYRIAIARTGRGPACLAALIWLWLTKDDYAGAYIDMGVTLFVLAAYAAFELWREQPGRRAWLALCAFSLGLAIGSKYQALTFLPLLACGIAWIDRRARTWAVALLWLAVPCAYWYLRNLLITGDPFNPLGGWLFGFFDWNAGDLQYQLQDIGWAHGWPSRVLWPAAVALLMKSAWQRPGQRTALLFCVYAVAVWLASSHYPRYLMPAYPLLALFAAKVWFAAFDLAAQQARRWPWAAALRSRGPSARFLGGCALVLLALVSAVSAKREWVRFAATPAQRQAVLRYELPDYLDMLGYLATLPRPRIYQIGMEGALYYAPRPIRGDHFGRWRYRDYLALPPPQLAARLRGENLDTLVVRLASNQALLSHPEFSASFRELRLTSHFGIYRVRPAEPSVPASPLMAVTP